MKFTLVIDPNKEEQIIMTVREETPLCAQVRQLILAPEYLTGYRDDEIRKLSLQQIVCITVLGGKTYAIDINNTHYRLKERLCELEPILPPSYIRINKSSIANEAHLQRFTAAFSGAVNAVFTGGFEEYVSRRCFTQIKRRLLK